MATAIQRANFHQILALILILLHTVAALPGGCGGKLEIINVESPSFNNSIWACSGINRSSLFGSAKVLLAVSNQDNATHCANYCATTSWSGGLNTGIYNDNSTCECWVIGIPEYPNLPAATTTPGVTYLDFFEIGCLSGPSKAQNWGEFTCPAGAYSEVAL